MADQPAPSPQAPTPDSRTIPLADLTADQVEVVVGINALLAGMVEDNRQHPRPSRTTNDAGLAACGDEPWARVDEDRTGRVLLIDGGRGLGKTSVLLTLIKGWSDVRANRGKPQDAAYADLGFEAVAHHVRALHILDFDPLPPGMPLYGWLITGFSRLVRYLAACTSRSTPARAHGEARAPWENDFAADDVQALWDRAYRAAVAGWSSGTLAAASKERLDDFVYDAREGSSHWTHLQTQFERLIDGLHETLDRLERADNRDNRVLVLPIDDVDLQPGRARELLTALRVLRHPRLVVVLTGDSEHLREGLVRELAEGREATSTDHDIARAILDKVIPPGHRRKIERLSISDALAHQDGAWGRRVLARHEGKDDPRYPLARIRRYGELFSDSLIKVRDLVQHLNSIDPQPFLETSWLRQILDPTQRTQKPAESFGGPVSPRSAELIVMPVITESWKPAGADGNEVAIARKIGFALESESSLRVLNGSDLGLLLSIDDGDVPAGITWTGDWRDFGLCGTRAVHEIVDAADVAWPELGFRLPWHAVWRAQEWLRTVRALEERGRPAMDALAFAWVLEQLRAHHRETAGGDLTPSEVGASSWDELLAELEREYRAAVGHRFHRFVRWYRHELARLAAPEYGMSAATQRRLIEHLLRSVDPVDRATWRERRQAAIEAGLRYADGHFPDAPAESLKARAARVVDSLNARDPDSPWVTMVASPRRWDLEMFEDRPLRELLDDVIYPSTSPVPSSRRLLRLWMFPTGKLAPESWASNAAGVALGTFLEQTATAPDFAAEIGLSLEETPAPSAASVLAEAWRWIIKRATDAEALHTLEGVSSPELWCVVNSEGELAYEGPDVVVTPIVGQDRFDLVANTVVFTARGQWDLSLQPGHAVNGRAENVVFGLILVVQSFTADRGGPATRIAVKRWPMIRTHDRDIDSPPLSAWVDADRFRDAWDMAVRRLASERPRVRSSARGDILAVLVLNLARAAHLGELRSSTPVGILDAWLAPTASPSQEDWRDLYDFFARDDGRRCGKALSDWAWSVWNSGLIGQPSDALWDMWDHQSTREATSVSPSVDSQDDDAEARDA